MMPAPLSDDDAARLRAAYEDGAAKTADLVERFDISNDYMYALARRQGWRRRKRLPGSRKDAVQRFSGVECPGLGACPLRAALHARLYELLARRVDEAAARVEQADSAERDVKLLAALAATLQRLGALDARAAQPEDPDDHADAERDRAELHRRLEALAGPGEPSGLPEADPPSGSPAAPVRLDDLAARGPDAARG
jgi:hypothetical protein